MRKPLPVFLCGLLLCSGTAAYADEPAVVEPAVIDQESLLARSAAPSPLTILDVRSAEEFAEGHVPGAVNIPLDELEARLGELTPQQDQDVVVYCKAGGRAAAALEFLQSQGFSHLMHLDGDIVAWLENGRPVKRL